MVKGTLVDEQTRCIHYHTHRDVIAIKFKCCNTWYACYYCHHEAAGHPATVWLTEEYEEQAVLCGVCKRTLTINQYLACNNQCLHCGALFNPGCSNHYPLYFGSFS
ncbi:MAG: hypothetical protein HRU69_12540 [Flammeovirgaceae bacterium]|nr:MAG: hypothetical protein HRU69_12540 [Flammeovirgaceae bacterium]